jgi:hypothetical protein
MQRFSPGAVEPTWARASQWPRMSAMTLAGWCSSSSRAVRATKATWPGCGVQVLRGFPHVFQDVDKVEDQVDPDAVDVGFGVDPIDLVVVAVDQHDPAA